MKRALLLTLALVCVLELWDASVASAKPVSVTVTILRFVELQNPDPQIGQGCCGDYYPSVRIAGGAAQTKPEIGDDADISPYWTFTATVDDSGGTIPIQIQIIDSDGALTAPDDVMDLNPRDGALNLITNFNPADGTWSGGTIAPNVGFSQGDGDHEFLGADEGGEAGKVLFDISLSNDGDTDDDGIPDGVERFGVHDGNGNLVADMAGMGADPCRKTIAVEVDWMAGAADGHSHRPTDAAVNDAVATMNNAPVSATNQCPYAGFPQRPQGVNLIVDRSNSIPEQANFPLSSLAGTRDGGNFNADRRPYFHYVLFVHNQSNGSSASGRCCVDNRDFVISLGSWANQVGTFRDQSGSLLHELGHSLGLGHGGDEARNYKPNYVSDMNYFFDPTGIPDSTIPANIDTDGNGVADTSFRLDYSGADLPDLAKSALSEPAGIADGTDSTFWYDPNYAVQSSAGNAGIDWNGASGIEPFPAPPGTPPVGVDLNADPCVSSGTNNAIDTATAGDDRVIKTGAGPVIVAGGDFTCNSAKSGDDSQDLPVGTNVLTNASLATLHGYDDWKNLKYRAAMSVNAGAASVNHGPDIGFEEVQAYRSEIFRLFRPDFTLTKSADRAAANPGDTVTYAVTAKNQGTGDGASVEIKDALPDGATSTASIGALAAGGSASRTFTYKVPCATADNTTLVNNASVSGTNVLNNPEIDQGNNSASASTTVHAPVLSLAKTAGSTALPGAAIPYRITYENTGTGEAQSVVVSDKLPADVYYSATLDLGSGPAPSSVTRNADGTTTLTWNVGAVAGGSGPHTIDYTARPSLLFLGGSTVQNDARVTFTNATGCSYSPVTSAGTTSITVLPPQRNPLSQGYWKNHPDEWTAEILARIQATDQRFDGADGSPPNQSLSPFEVMAVLGTHGTSQDILRLQLLAAYFNLATHRINAGTAIRSTTSIRLGLSNVRDAARYAIATLTLPLIGNRARYSDAIRILDEINANKSEIY